MSIFFLLIILIFISLIFPYLGFLFFPGFILFFLFRKEIDDFLIKINLVFGFSFAYWIITFWFLYFPIFKFWIWGSIIFFGIISFILGYIKRKEIIKIEYFLLLIFLIFGLVRFFPMIINEAPPGGDITMHTYNSLLITLWQKIPESYQPIFDMKGFGAQPQGFSILSAIFAFLSNLPIYRATFFISCFTYFLIFGGFYVFLRSFLSPKSSLATAIILLVFSRDPQNFYLWGGTPSILAFFFSLISFYFFVQEIKNERISFLNIFLFNLFLAAGFLTHFIPLAGFLIILLIITLYELVFYHQKRRLLLKKIFLSILFFSILSFSYFIIFKKTITSEREWQVIFNWNDYLWQDDFATRFICQKFAFLGSFLLLFLPFIKMVITISLPILILVIIGLIIRRKDIGNEKLLLLLFLPVLIILYLNLFLKIKFTRIFYPERISLYFHLPIGIFIGKLMEKIFYEKIKKILICFIIYVVMVITILKISFKDKDFLQYREKEKPILKLIGYEFLCRNFYRYLFWQGNYSLKENDLEAFEWIKKNCEKGIILTNYSDAGIWIPAVLGRPVYLAHIVFNLFDEYEEFIKKSKLEDFKYLYIGSKTIGQNIFFTNEDLPREAVKKIYQNKGVTIYQVINPVPLLSRVILHQIPQQTF